MEPFWIALSTLTLFPVPKGAWRKKGLRHSLFFYPSVGALVGVLGALNLFWPAPAAVKALGILVTGVVLTRGLHLDGLADCLDGWLGGHGPKERRRIMKDPAVGSFGAAGLTLLLLSKFLFLQWLLEGPRAGEWLVFIPAAARWAVVLACALHPPRTPYGGLAKPLLGFPRWGAAAGALWLTPMFLLSPPDGALALLLCAAAAAGMVAAARRMVGALTGDALGALVELTEAMLLLLAASRGA